MINENSGKVYRFKLDHNLGFGYAEFLDFTDITKFSGKIAFVYDLLQREDEPPLSLNQVRSQRMLISHHPLLKFPNIKGKGSWQLIGQALYLNDPSIIFKDISSTLKNDNWAELNGWHTYTNFKEVGPVVPYENVRKLELATLYGMKELEIRSTMHVLISEGLDVTSFYDLKNFHIRSLYIHHLNTCIPEKKANILLAKLN